jgi:hypothetical protein
MRLVIGSVLVGRRARRLGRARADSARDQHRDTRGLLRPLAKSAIHRASQRTRRGSDPSTQEIKDQVVDVSTPAHAPLPPWNGHRSLVTIRASLPQRQLNRVSTEGSSDLLLANNATLNVRGEERQIRPSSAPVGHRVVGVPADRSAAGLFTSPRSAATTPQRSMTGFAKQGSLWRSTRRRHDFLFGSTRLRRTPRRSGRAGDEPDARSAPVSASRLGCSMRKAVVAHDGDTRLLGG